MGSASIREGLLAERAPSRRATAAIPTSLPGLREVGEARKRSRWRRATRSTGRSNPIWPAPILPSIEPGVVHPLTESWYQ